jgi:hypothetical protein
MTSGLRLRYFSLGREKPMPKRPIRRLDDKFSIEDVGSTLLDDLAKGLYKPPEVIREYVQNAVDAHRVWLSETGSDPEGPIQIEIRGNSISILDYGIGMAGDEIRSVKSIAVSRKRRAEVSLTGYKGVGIWAGLSYFETLTLFSTKRGSDRGYQLTIHFKKIVDSIDDRASIGDVLNPNYSLEEYEVDEDDHYTDVTLHRPTRAIEEFMDPDKISDAVRRICPCEVNPTFVFHDEVADWYAQQDLELFPIEVDGIRVYKSYPSTVERFKPGVITINDIPVAKYWMAVNRANGVLSPQSDQIAGFCVIQNGFILGGQNLYSESTRPGFEPLKTASYLNWHVGEIHVISPDLRPDLPRREFEESELTRQFIQRLRKWYQDTADEARVLAEKRNKLIEYADIERRLEGLVAQIAPLALTEDDAKWLTEVQSQLMKQDKKLEPPKKNLLDVGYQTAALRDQEVKSARRKVLAKIAKLLPSYSAADTVGSKSREDEKLSVDQVSDLSEKPETMAAGQPRRLVEQSSGITDLAPSNLVPSKLATMPKWTDWSSPEAQMNEFDTWFRSFLDVVLGLLAEILNEDIPENPEKVLSIVNKLRTRVSLVVPNVQL